MLVHASWLGVLGREALTRRFYRALERVVATVAADARTHVPAEDRHELSSLHLSRLLFLSFLETKGWLNGDQRFLLENGFAPLHARGESVLEKALIAVQPSPSFEKRQKQQPREVQQRELVPASAGASAAASAATVATTRSSAR